MGCEGRRVVKPSFKICQGLQDMPRSKRILPSVGLVAIVGLFPAAVHGQHACDDLGDKGWRTVPTVETVAQSDSAPVKGTVPGSWFVERTITLLPLCNYFNAVGNYSLRSYSLSPETRKERVEVCRGGAAGASVAVAPYSGRCPPG